MKTITFHSFFFAVIFTFALSIARPAFAHGDEPRLEISVERVNPGGVVDVRGVDFEPEETITLMLVNAQTAVPLGGITADIEGVFLQIVTLPVDLQEGVYNFLALTDDHNITSPDLTVVGPPIYGEAGGQGPRDEDDSLLAPVPTFAPGVVPGAPPETAPSTLVDDAPPVSAWNRNMVILAVSMIIVVIVMLGLRRRARQ